jgi:type VI secretion system protein ImpG
VKTRSTYYHDELNYLRQMGREFSQRYPETAGLLGVDGQDPDVERLLEGFAFLTSRLHERLDSQYGEIAGGLLQILWPEALRPVPSCTMVQFQPIRNRMRTALVIEKGAVLQSKPRSWGRHTFRTTRRTVVHPLDIATKPRVGIHNEANCLRIGIDLLPGVSLKETSIDSLDIYIHGDDQRFVYDWFLWLTQYVHRAFVHTADGSHSAPISVSAPAFDTMPSTSQIDGGELPGYRLLREHLTLPEQHLFFRIDGLGSLTDLNVSDRFELLVDFGDAEPTPAMHQIQHDSFRLNCVPAVNIFKASARFTLDHTRSEYLLRPDEIDMAHAEIYSVERVIGIERGPDHHRRHYHPFLTRAPQAASSHFQGNYYRTRFADTHLKLNEKRLSGKDCFISFGPPGTSDMTEAVQTVSVDLLCCHRGGVLDLNAGDLCAPTADVPANSLTYENIARPSDYYPAISDPEYYWFLVNSLGMSRRTLASLDRLKSTLNLQAHRYVARSRAFRGSLDRLKEYTVHRGITIENGVPVRILEVEMIFDCDPDDMSEHHFISMIVSEFLRQIVTINSRIRLRTSFHHDKAVVLTWPHRTGTCTTI